MSNQAFTLEIYLIGCITAFLLMLLGAKIKGQEMIVLELIINLILCLCSWAFVLVFIAYSFFEFLTPSLKKLINKEIKIAKILRKNIL